MKQQSKNKQLQILEKVKAYYQESKNSSIYQNWLANAKQAWNFYDGEQWTESEKLALEKFAQAPIVINKIATKIDSVSGNEISSRTRVAYRSRTGEQNEENTARALTDLALYVAEKNDQSIELSNMFKAGLITGVGWLDIGVKNNGNIPYIFNNSENELNVIFDVRSRSLDYSDARFVAREKWLDIPTLQALFKEKANPVIKELQAHSYNQNYGFSFNEELTSAEEYLNTQEQRAKVVEVQFKQTEKLYTVTNKLGQSFSTFDKTLAYKEKENDVTETFNYRTYLVYFTEHTVLEFKALDYDFNDFTLVPFFFKRKRTTGEPYGLVKSAIDPQKEYNKRRSKALHLLNTVQVIADVDAVEDPNILAREAARPDGVILKRPGKDLKILRNAELANSQVAIMNQATADIQETTGVFDDRLGKKTDAVSGVAIAQRQIASTNNQMFAFDNLRKVKKQLGRMVLSLIRQYFTSEMIINITDDISVPKLVSLNKAATDEQGNPIFDENNKLVKINDVSFGDFDIHVEEVKDALSSQEYELNQLLALKSAGVAIPNDLLIESTSLKSKDKIISTNQQLNNKEA
tara:strand:+ start:1482 stop:3212 length:1731 start_codon:yes stop_codon:yes gene_type:complete